MGFDVSFINGKTKQHPSLSPKNIIDSKWPVFNQSVHRSLNRRLEGLYSEFHNNALILSVRENKTLGNEMTEIAVSKSVISL